MAWYKVTLTDDDIRARKHLSLQDKFGALFLANKTPKDAAMFCNRAGIGNHFYFSPGAARIANSLIAQYGGVECPTPKAADLSLLVGGSG